MKNLPRSKLISLMSPDINKAQPTRLEIADVLRDLLQSAIWSYRESDGVIRDARAGREIICLDAAMDIVRRSAYT